MLGSISKVRPCGHHHYYKYAHVKNRNDVNCVEASITDNYKNDEYNAVMDFSFYNLVASWGYDNGPKVFSNRAIKKFVISAPSITNIKALFAQPYLSGMTFPEQEVVLKDFNWSKITYFDNLFDGCGIKDLPEDFKPTNIPSSTRFMLRDTINLFKKGENGIYYFPYNEYIDRAEGLAGAFYNYGNRLNGLKFIFDSQYKFENVKNINSICYNVWPYNSTGIQNFTGFSLKNVESATSAFKGCVGLKTFSTTDNMDKLTNATDMFSGCYNLTSLYPDRTSFTLKSLSNAKNMFGNNTSVGTGSKLDKPSTLKLCNALPTHTDGAEHLITIGIHIDHKYDPEVNVALKKVCKTYTTPIEEAGSSLGTTVSSDKGWTLEIQWNGTATSNAYPAP